MAAKLNDFQTNPSGVTHQAYASSALFPVAPEYSTGETLLAAAYRRLVTGESDAVVDLEDIDSLADRVAAEAPAEGRINRDALRMAWEDLIVAPGGLTSPTPRGAQGSRRLRQLMPLVPELSRVSGVLGKVRNRWQPGNLLLATIYSGASGLGHDLVVRLRDSLVVDHQDDYLARYLEGTLAAIRHVAAERERPAPPDPDELQSAGTRYPAAWRSSTNSGYLPCERFVEDLNFVIDLKPRLTRRQWTVVMESILRLGMGLHQLWLWRLNARVWTSCIAAYDGLDLSEETVIERCWPSQEGDEPLLQLAENAMPLIRRYLSEFWRARIGLNLTLFALEDSECGWGEGRKLGAVDDVFRTPSAAIAAFLAHVAANRIALADTLAAQGWDSLAHAAADIADHDRRFLTGAATRNPSFFVRYSLGQLQPNDDAQRQYDQGYLLYRNDRRGDRWIVQPAPSMLMMLVHCASRASGHVPASTEQFRTHLRGYGIAASADELRNGVITRDLERLGLVVDSPDAAGGRLLVDPFLVLRQDR